MDPDPFGEFPDPYNNSYGHHYSTNCRVKIHLEQSFFTELAYLRQSHLEFLKGRDPDPNWIRTGIQQLCLPISVFIIWIQMIRSGTTQLKIWKKTRLTWQKFTFFTYNFFWSLKKRFEHKINCLNKKHFKQFFFKIKICKHGKRLRYRFKLVQIAGSGSN